ncbi:hypothetical protein [Candidatus Hodarchaeum mangrovi]
MYQNLLVLAGLSHSGKDLLFNQIAKFSKSESNQKVEDIIIYFDWLFKTFKKSDTSYLNDLLAPIRERILKRIHTLIYVHDITYQRLDETVNDFKEVITQIESYNKSFKVILLLNRGHLIPNDIERNNILRNVSARLQQIIPQDISAYVVSLKGPDEQRLTNMIISQIISRGVDFSLQKEKEKNQQTITLNNSQQKAIQSILTEKMTDYGFAGAYILTDNNKVILAKGKNQSWEEKVGPQIIRVLAQEGAFEVSQGSKINIVRVEDFLMITQLVTNRIKLILLGRETNFKLNKESFATIERKCSELVKSLSAKL